MNSVLITGSNRGLGLEWVHQYAKAGWRVFATCRFPENASNLEQLVSEYPNVSIHKLDVTNPVHIHNLVKELNDVPLDILINNAGVYLERWGKDKLGQIDFEAWQATFEVNTFGVMRVTEALIENLANSDKGLIVAISSHMGSIADIEAPNDYAYRSSKAALNAAMKGLSIELKNRGIGVLILHPGWVRTRMGGENAPIKPEDSVSSMRRIVSKYKNNQSGHFYRFDGSEIAW